MGGRKWRYGTLSPFHISWDKSNDSKLNGLSDPKSQSLFSALSGLKMGTSSPTITPEGDANGAPHADASSYAKKFSGRYKRRIIKGGVGHNLPHEAPQAFVEAVSQLER